VVSADTIICDPTAVPITVEDCSSIDEILVEMAVYPNPTEGLVYVTASLEKESLIALSLTNSLGQNVYSEAIGSASSFDNTYDWSTLPKGIYTVCLEINNQKTFEKIVLQ
jgi:hypothetical protein